MGISRTKLEELENYAEASNDELGEYLKALIQLGDGIGICATGEFQAALEKEIRYTLDWLKDNYRIEETEKTATFKTRRLVSLEEN